jgi:nitrate reductase NapE component
MVKKLKPFILVALLGVIGFLVWKNYFSKGTPATGPVSAPTLPRSGKIHA